MSTLTLASTMTGKRDAQSDTTPRHPFRPDVQALRALAVALVVTFHLWPTGVRGGYVGVDVFFVISGFLITGLLTREAFTTGRVRLLHFWARRVRRLLPAALAVLFVVAGAVWLFVPHALWRQFFTQIGGSAVYGQNWVLIANAVNYFAAQDAASPVQHFWTLSVEEQFYLVWPLLLLIPLFFLGRGRGSRRLVAVLFTAATLASFVYGIVLAWSDPSVSYLATTSRAWEFGIGGLLALATVPKWIPPRLRALLSWAGIAAIVVAVFVYDGATPFPGTAALLPVLGTVAVIAAGESGLRWGPDALMRRRPVQWLGDTSYSLYLWHWPLIALAPFLVARFFPGFSANGPIVSLSILASALLLAHLSKRFLEDPVRHSSFLASHRPRRSFVFMAAGMAVVVGVSGVAWSVATAEIRSSRTATASLLARSPDCFGAAAMDPASTGCPNPALDSTLVPSPVAVSSDIAPTCIIQGDRSEAHVCYAGAPAKSATKTVALIGDSHAAQWLPALEGVADKKGWRIVEILKANCPLNASRRQGNAPFADSCAAWNKNVQAALRRMPQVSAVFTSADVKDLFRATDGTGFANGVRGYVHAWAALPKTIRHVYAIKDTPHPDSHTQSCVQLLSPAQRLRPGACHLDRDRALGPDPIATAAGKSRRATLLNLSDMFCWAGQCDPVIGHVMVYRDDSHISSTYATTLAPYLGRALRQSE